jgi:hypothetical protein
MYLYVWNLLDHSVPNENYMEYNLYFLASLAKETLNPCKMVWQAISLNISMFGTYLGKEVRCYSYSINIEVGVILLKVPIPNAFN